MTYQPIIALALLIAASPALAQHGAHGGSHAQHTDTAFGSLQKRGATVMGVDQYTSSHRFEPLPNGGRIELQRDTVDAAGTRVIRTHLRDVSRRFRAGDFSLSKQVHAKPIPGAAALRSARQRVRYEYRDLPRGGEVRIITTDPKALTAVHEFLAFQRTEHRAGK